MAVDETLLNTVSSGECPPVLRFYQWDPPAVSLGYSQRADDHLDLEACHRAGVDVVRRISGGRAVLHWEELTYAICFAQSDPILGRPAAAAQQLVTEALAAGLHEFGVAVQVTAQGSVTAKRARWPGITSRAPGLKGPCFSSTSRLELTCGGRKLVGSAQRRVRGGVIQHGSILIGPGHRLLPQLLKVVDAEERYLLLQQLDGGSTHLGEWCAGSIDVDALAHCLEVGFRRILNTEFEHSELSLSETDHVNVLAATTAEVVGCG